MFNRNIFSYLLISGVLAAGACPSSAATFVAGNVELNYVSYDASAGGKQVYSGNTFSQKYSLDWVATNRLSTLQRQSYLLQLGYDWLSFDTSVHDLGQTSSLKQAFGKFRYKGDVIYQPPELPFRFTAYASDDYSPYFKTGITSNLVGDELAYTIDNRYKGGTMGFTFAYDADRAATAGMRGLPKLYVDYRESAVKLTDAITPVDNKTRELAVAGLNKENNWLKYSNIRYDNYIRPSENYELNTVQIGLVDNVGRRKWSSLTNWIDVSADGSIMARKSTATGEMSEEYDLNLMAIATRKNWNARTFMNYNRAFTVDALTETTRVPLYLKGIYSPDTDWFANVTVNRGARKFATGSREDSYTNSVSAGINTFNRSSFTLSPSVSVTTSRSFGSYDAYDIRGEVNTTSTRLFSDRHTLFAGYRLQFKDDGTNSAESASWEQTAKVRWDYRIHGNLKTVLKQELRSGNGPGYVDLTAIQQTGGTFHRNTSYIRSITDVGLAWTPISRFSATIDAEYDLSIAQGEPNITYLNFINRLTYDNRELLGRLETYYYERDNGADGVYKRLENRGVLEYRPNRYHEGLLQYTLEQRDENKVQNTQVDLIQRYRRNFFTSSGSIRTYAALSEEFSYQTRTNGSDSVDAMYLLLSGTYSPTSRISLYGSAKFLRNPGSFSMIYNAGLTADFKLMSANLDYTLGKRDSDNRLEKKFAASVRRTF